MTLDGREGEAGNVGFGAFYFAEPGFGGPAALEKADRPQRVGSVNSSEQEADVRHDFVLSGRYPAHC